MRRFSVILTIFITITVLNSCDLLGDGSDTLIKESPNNKHSKKAVLFLRQAGATVANSYQISITDYSVEFDTTAVGNTFTCDDDHGKANLNPKSISFAWVSDNLVEISYDGRLRTFLQEKKVDGVTLVYKTN